MYGMCVCLLIIITYFRYQEIYNGSTDTLEQEVKELTIELNKLDSPLVFCHNDLLCGNVIYNEKEGNDWCSSCFVYFYFLTRQSFVY